MPTISELARNLGFSCQYMQRCVKAGCPTDTFDNARLWFGAHRQHPKKEPKSPISTEELAHKYARQYADDPKVQEELAELFKTLIHSAIASEEAFRNLEEAFIERKTSKISTWLNLHSKSVEDRVKAERMVREEQERRGILIPLAVAQDMARRSLGVIIARLRNLPQNAGARCNPANAHQAMGILEAECEGLLADARRAIAADTI
jgi:hypothetical protein